MTGRAFGSGLFLVRAIAVARLKIVTLAEQIDLRLDCRQHLRIARAVDAEMTGCEPLVVH